MVPNPPRTPGYDGVKKDTICSRTSQTERRIGNLSIQGQKMAKSSDLIWATPTREGGETPVTLSPFDLGVPTRDKGFRF